MSPLRSRRVVSQREQPPPPIGCARLPPCAVPAVTAPRWCVPLSRVSPGGRDATPNIWQRPAAPRSGCLGSVVCQRASLHARRRCWPHSRNTNIRRFVWLQHPILTAREAHFCDSPKIDDLHVRSGVAANASCPPGSDLRLAQDNNELVRSSLAYNTACPPNTLTLLAQDKARFVREAVAANSCCPPDVLARLAEDEDRNIRHRVAAHPICPSEVLDAARRRRGQTDSATVWPSTPDVR